MAMRGGRRGGHGRKPKPLEELQLKGTFRPALHAHLLPRQAQTTPSRWEGLGIETERSAPGVPPSLDAFLEQGGLVV